MIEAADAPTLLFGGSLVITGLVFFVRFLRRMFYGEKRDTSIDLASQSLFENLRLENQRMSNQMAEMSTQLNLLSQENRELNQKVSELSDSVRKLVALEKENIMLQEDILDKDRTIKELSEELLELSKQLSEALIAVRLRASTRS